MALTLLCLSTIRFTKIVVNNSIKEIPIDISIVSKTAIQSETITLDSTHTN